MDFNGGVGQDVIVAAGPPQGDPVALVTTMQATFPGLRLQGTVLMDQSNLIMNQQLAWARQQIDILLRDQAATVQNEAMA